ncbi:hypothetical protein ABD91_01995 [Lysinibacillus sphaericus]|uniref:DUF2325 domain-containing protein n=1 Tax=Lysinibacillus sphaericus TaxID=1421 RepID=UPI0018CF2EF8|nr:DUF2325 domain-containing protein [Lysinibacillus sphaericus]MBG9689694.1 hypothetical protein [Lysinibacillus sphaericus]
MNLKTIGIIGGMYKEKNLKKFEEKYSVNVICKDGRNSRKNYLFNMAKQVDCLVIVKTFCGHETMYNAKEAAKKIDTPIVYPRETNMEKVIQSAVAALA